jgi:hypothetical protein
MMKKDLIIGGASNYGWEELKYWVNSIKKSGFSGDIALVATNIKKSDIEKLVSMGVILSLYGKQDNEGNFVAHSNGAPHVERFFYLWNFLNTTKESYRYVITTDTRDVVFQTNPSEWLDCNLIQHFLVASCEGIRYKNEPWNNKNMYDTFGPFFHNMHKDNLIYNVGTIAGDFDYVKGLLLTIFQMSINRPIPIVDQAVYNMIINTIPWYHDTYMAMNEDGWAIQLGATVESIRSGKGDLGMSYQNNIDEYLPLYEDDQPNLVDGHVVNKHGTKFCIVHQYDRTLAWQNDIMELYK